MPTDVPTLPPTETPPPVSTETPTPVPTDPTASDGNTDTRAYGSTNTASDGNTDTRAYGSTNTASDGNTDTRAYGSTNTASDGNTDTRGDQPANIAPDHHAPTWGWGRGICIPRCVPDPDPTTLPGFCSSEMGRERGESQPDPSSFRPTLMLRGSINRDAAAVARLRLRPNRWNVAPGFEEEPRAPPCWRAYLCPPIVKALDSQGRTENEPARLTSLTSVTEPMTFLQASFLVVSFMMCVV